MSLVTRAPTDVVVCARCGPSSPFDEDPGLAAELDDATAKAEENDDGSEGEEAQDVQDELEERRYGEEIRENIAAALLGKRLLPHETPFLAGTIPCDECGGDPKVVRHTPNPSVFLQLEQSFQTDASLTAGEFFWPRRLGFPRAFLARDEEEDEEAAEERERNRFFSGHGQPLVFPDRSSSGEKRGATGRRGREPMKMGVAAAAAAEKTRARTESQQRTFGEAPSRPRMDFFWRDLLASARASPWNMAARVRGGGGEDGPGGWTSSESEEDEPGLDSDADVHRDGENAQGEDEEEEELDEDGNPIPKSKKKKKLTPEEEEEEKRRKEERKPKVRKDPPPLTLDELFGDDLAIEYALAFEDPEGGEGEGEGEGEDLEGAGDEGDDGEGYDEDEGRSD